MVKKERWSLMDLCFVDFFTSIGRRERERELCRRGGKLEGKVRVRVRVRREKDVLMRGRKCSMWAHTRSL